MKRLKIIFLICFTLLSASGWSQVKIAYVNSQAILASYSKARQAQAEINTLYQRLEKLTDKRKDWQLLKDQIDAQILLLSEAKLAERRRQLQDLSDEIQQLEQSDSGKIHKRQEELLAPFVAEIKETVKNLCNKIKCDLVFDIAKGDILYADAYMVDLTDDILKSLEGLPTKTTSSQISSVSKVAYINSTTILSSYLKGTEVQAQIEELNRQQKKGTLDSAEVYRKKQEYLEPILSNINTTVNRVGDISKCELILDVAKGNVFYANASVVDFTDEVLGFLRGSTVGISNYSIYPVSKIAYINSQNFLNTKTTIYEINQQIRRIGERNQYDLILDDINNNILYADASVADLTDQIQELTRGVSPIPADDKPFIVGKYYALIIAEKDYLYIDGLTYPIKDAERIKEVLTKNYIFDEPNVIFLKNPGRKTIIKTLEDLRTKLTANDNLFIFYAGHGYWDEGLEEGYWLPKEASWDDKSEWLTNNDLTRYIRGIKTKHTLLVTDACFSGAIFKVREIYKPDISVEKTYQMPSRRAITSGAMKAVPDKSVFVEFLIKRLMDNDEKYLYAQKLFMMIKDPVINNSPLNQTPLYGVIWQTGDEGGDFIFIRRQ